MRHQLVPILSILAAVGIAPATLAADELILKQDEFTLNFGIDVQARQEYWSGKNTVGGDWDGVLGRNGKSNIVMDDRRARFFFYGQFAQDWKYYIGLLNDKVDNTGYNNAARGTQIFKAYIEKDFKDDDITQTLHAGLDYPFFNIAIQGDPRWLFCNQRATGTLMGVRGEGLRYKFSNPMVTFGVDVMEPLDPAKNAAVTNADTSDGLFYSGRLEVSCLGGPKPVYMESYAGQPGHSLIVAADIGYDSKNLAAANVSTKALGYAAEALFHWDGLTALAEARFLKTEIDSLNGAAAPPTVNSRIFLVQAGYAFPIAGGSMYLEPAVRYTKINYDSDNTEVVNYNGGAAFVPPNLTGGPGGTDSENGLSGNQIDIGVNWYIKGHNVQMQLDYSHWTAESGSGKQDVIRLQEQIWF